MMTFATVCNNVIECKDNLDEPSICSDNTIAYVIISLLCLLLIFAITSVSLRFKNSAMIKVESKNLELVLSPESHGTPELSESINIEVMKGKFLENYEFWKTKCCNIFDFEYQIHNESIAEALSCMKTNLDPAAVEIIKDFKFPGFVDRTLMKCPAVFQKMQRLKEFLNRSNKANIGLAAIANLRYNIFYYLDLF